MADKYILVDLDDAQTSAISDVISNKTSKKVLALLAEKEMSVSDIATAAKIPLNTAQYNVQKLLEASFIEKSKTFFWSAKGKKIPTYRASNKKIVISPKSSFKGIIPALIFILVATLALKLFLPVQQVVPPTTQTDTLQDFIAQKTAEMHTEETSAGAAASSLALETQDAAVQADQSYAESAPTQSTPELWFLLGALSALFAFLIWNWKKVW